MLSIPQVNNLIKTLSQDRISILGVNQGSIFDGRKSVSSYYLRQNYYAVIDIELDYYIKLNDGVLKNDFFLFNEIAIGSPLSENSLNKFKVSGHIVLIYKDNISSIEIINYVKSLESLTRYYNININNNRREKIVF